jgi:hypothetical protein
MKRFILLSLLAMFATPLVFSQKSPSPLPLAPLSEYQLMRLKEVPQAQAPLTRGPLTLPVFVDNSTQPYFRTLFTQSGLECGQASSIGLGLTYEVDLKRTAPANLPQNQFATYFTYNYINGGSDAGVSFLESWEIVKRCGNPSVLDYGGLSAGGPARWMSGYDKYYNAMHNRITDVAVIYINTIEGLNMLRSWIHNHMDQASIGGVAHFYSQYGAVNNQLPAGTPLAGQYVLTTWGSSPNHAMTILGYNDSICWDYNGDGQYTNNIDLNGDGILNLKDWEIGGFKIANTYGNVGNWANQGFAWATYKSFADNPASGGIWNNAAYIAYAKQDLSPKLTMKFSLKHTCRNKLKIMAGVSNNLSSTEPDVTLNLPILDFAGGEKYMQGGTTEADKTIELGLDLTPLLSVINSGQPAKFFLTVQENDPGNTATGQIISFDLIDYTNGTVTIPGSNSNVPLVENGTTTLSITATLNVNKPSVTTTTLPEAKIYEPYSYQLNVSGGSSPYKWRVMTDFTETPSTGTFPVVNSQQLTVNSNSSGYAGKELPFAFPFYGKSYTKVYPHVDGYIMFDDHPVPWPYIIYERTFFKTNRCISPFMGKPLVIESGDNDGIWYSGNADSACFRWKLSVYGIASTTEVNIAVTLYPNGHINFYYGNVNAASMKYIAGLSNGDGVNYKYCAITDSLVTPTPNTKFYYSTQPFPTEMSISETGLFSGTPAQSYANLPIKFYVEDNNFLYATKTINFNTKGVEITYLIEAGNDSIIEYGETVQLTPTLKNVSSSALHNVVMKIAIPDNYIALSDSVETIGILNPGQVLTLPDAFTFEVANATPDNHMLSLNSQVLATEDNFNRNIPVPVRAPDLQVFNVSLSDGNNNILMPGESGTLIVSLKNNGGAEATDLEALLSTIDPYLSVIQGNYSLDTLDANSLIVINFSILATSDCPNPHTGYLNFQTQADKDVFLADSIYITIGSIIEDFETGDFTKFPWQKSGSAEWAVSPVLPYEGAYSAQSGTMTDNQECSLFLELNVIGSSEISFYRKVSSEVNYDFLYFYIDGQEMAKWSGDVPWSKVSFNVQPGTHIFRWKYSKDYSVSTGYDKAWIDYISWPPLQNYLLIAYAGPDDIACSGQGYPLAGQVINASSMFWSTNGDGNFTNVTSPNAIYTPGPNDLSNGDVSLTIHASQLNLPTATDEVFLNLVQGPEVNAGPDLSVCPGESISISQAVCSNTGSLLWTTSGDGTFSNPALLNTQYIPGINDQLNGIVTLTLTGNGPTDCQPVSDALNVTVFPAVITDAGDDQTIQYNTFTQLNGSAGGGSGTYTAAWEPADLLVNPGLFNAVTLNLLQTQVFTLTATNNLTGCSSIDQVIISVAGGPLSVTATATPAEICLGSNSQLQAIAGGGSGNYTYSWSSNPPGFTSTLQNPLVTPEVNTSYSVVLSDGFATVDDQVSVIVNSTPSTPALPSGPSAVNVFLTGSTQYSVPSIPGATSYSWIFTPAGAGNTTPNANVCTIQWNPAFEGIAELRVYASNSCGMGELSEILYITANHEVAVPEQEFGNILEIYPNPGKGLFTLSAGKPGVYSLWLSNVEGQILIKTEAIFNLRHDLFILKADNLPSGTYYLTIKQGEQVYNRKLIIMK